MAELETLKATLETKTGEHADAEKQLADNKVLLHDTKVQLEADEKFFEETKASCKAKAAEWAERTRLRTEELNGMQKGVAILEGGSETFQGAYNPTPAELPASPAAAEPAAAPAAASFLQVINSHQTEMEQSRKKAFSMLQKLVKKGGGLRLALLAAEVRSGGHFDKIIKMMDKMIADLRVEEQEDIKARDTCNNQENALKARGEDADYNIEKKGKLKDRQEAKKTEVIKAKEATQDEIAIANTTMAEMLADRNQENANFLKL